MINNNIIPARYKNADFSSISPSVRKSVEEMVKNPRKNKSVYLWGEPGRGKTYSAWAIYKYFQAYDLPVMLVKSSEIVEAIKFTFEGITERSEPFYDRLKEIENFRGLLIIDDIGAEKYSEGVIVKYQTIVDHRYEELLPMAFTSNVDLTELGARIGERIASRLFELCHTIQLTGESKR